MFHIYFDFQGWCAVIISAKNAIAVTSSLDCFNSKLLSAYRRILKSEPPYPQEMSAVAKDLIQHLLMKDPKKRLGCGPRDADEIKEHLFFQVKHVEPVVFYVLLFSGYLASLVK